MVTRRTFLSLIGISLLCACAPTSLQGCAGIGESHAADLDDIAEAPAELTAFLFDTVVRVQAYCPQTLLDSVHARLEYFESIFSRTIEGSDIAAINRAQGEPVPVHPETADIIDKALGYSGLSDGLFDITIGAVTELWDFKSETVPDPDALAAALPHVDYRTIGLAGQVVTLDDPDAKLDLGGIAKGYIADDIVAMLADGGCASALVNLGGNTYAVGSRPDGTPWSVGLQDPNRPRGTVLATTPATNRSVVASGINERSFERDGVLYHHLLDPATGMPADNGLASTTVTSDRSIDGDALTTISFLMGRERGIEFIGKQPGVEALFVSTDGTTAQTDDMEVSWL